MAARQQILIELVDKVSGALGRIEKNMTKLEQNSTRLNRGFGGAATAAKGFVAVLAVREVIKFGDAILQTAGRFEEYKNQLRLITDNQFALEGTFRLLQDSARETRSEFGDTVDLFQKLTLATKNMGVSQESVLKVTERFQKALAISGADANTASGAIRQLGQAMASGQVRGDEFNSIVEALGPALNIMAEQTGVNVGELRKLAQSGQLTAQRFYEMLEASTALDEAFGKTEQTVAQAKMALDQAFDEFLVEINEAIGLTDAFKTSTGFLTGILEDMTTVLRGAKVEMEEISKALELGETTRATQLLSDRIVFLTRNFAKLGMTSDEINAELNTLVGILADIQTGAYDAGKGVQTTSNAMSDLDLAMAALKPYEGLIKRVADTDSLYELGDAVTRAEMDLSKLESAQRALMEVFLESAEVTLEMRVQMRGLTEAIIVQKARLQELRAEQANANAELSGFAKYYADLIENANKAATEQVYQSQAQQKLNEDLAAGRISLDAYAQAMKSVSPTTKKAAGATRDLAGELQNLEQKYSSYLGNQVQLAQEAQIADVQIFKDGLDQKLISEDEYNKLVIASKESLADRIRQINEQITQDEQNQLMQRVRNQLKAGDMTISAADSAALRQIGAQNRLQDAVEQRIKFEMMSEMEKASFIMSSAADSFKTLGQYNKRAFQAYKAFAIAQTIIDTISSAQKAFTSLAGIPFVGPALGAAAAAAAVVAGMARVNQIRSMQYTGYAAGGEMTVGRPAIVGENGPEVVVPKQPSVVMPNSVKERLDGMGGGGPVTVNFNITTLDAKDFDTLLIERRSVITGIINDAMTRRGRQGVMT